jgi:UDP-N-acetylmuramoyl-L-alanyl-D-glutamate--2,6-diaminopimelate ligase
VVETPDPRRVYALAAAAFWGAQPKTCVAVTGTNGKTSVADFCARSSPPGHTPPPAWAPWACSQPTGYARRAITPPGLTTPDAADVAEMLARLAGRASPTWRMEASSHGIDQRRLDGVRLKAAGFTNLTQDHLDYHGDMAAYRAAKLRLFDGLLPRGGRPCSTPTATPSRPSPPPLSPRRPEPCSPSAQAGQGIFGWPNARRPQAASVLRSRPTASTYGVRCRWPAPSRPTTPWSPPACAIAAGEPVDGVLAALEALQGAPGRLQHVGAGRNGGEAYVDYAHTPDGLETVLSALRPHVAGKLVVVFGAGGDRDRTKRPLMGAIAARLADIAIVTDDNPRSEDPAAIRAEVLAAATGAREIGDRREAIAPP